MAAESRCNRGFEIECVHYNVDILRQFLMVNHSQRTLHRFMEYAPSVKRWIPPRLLQKSAPLATEA